MSKPQFNYYLTQCHLSLDMMTLKFINMKKHLLFAFLSCIFIYSCSTDQVLPVQQIAKEKQDLQFIDLFQDFESGMIAETDLDIIFMLHVNAIRFATENDNLTREQFETFIDESNNLTFATFLNQLKGSPHFNDDTVAELIRVYNNVLNLANITNCIEYIDDKIVELSEGGTSEEPDFMVILLQGYNNILKHKITGSDTILSRNCIRSCLIENAYGFIWWTHHNLYVSTNPWLCSGWGFICPYAADYADAILLGWCQSECEEGPPVDPCDGVTCIHGYHCVDGDCVPNPYADPECENNGDCLPGEQCFRGTCITL